MIQEILVFITFFIAVGFIVKKFFWKNSKKTTENGSACGKSGCGCS
ncbi:FeoB-associated Cys-rich membrane protein [Mesonia aestuariivivens]|uniref:FeoB-associated Cys-rich membrane protein n=1 Tax=Mesonia aestuariivivens TaxID=2796128 RepID=A0ABS6W1J8_9FLAO|nr:FeoB-associated Cys-rich membrane protein [Mesonia aestuariivivens]MBW2961689.1 FeoB-associated Cys-rich membrane protein [Mesonia aestuariivivens]